MREREIQLLLKKLALFTILGLLFWFLTPGVGYLFWAVLLLVAAGWLLLGYRKDPRLVKRALLWGLGFALLDFFVENTGAALGLWFVTTTSVLFLGAVPIEVSILAVIGGGAWIIYQPKLLDIKYLLYDAIVFGLGGMFGEVLLIQNGMMKYAGFWNSVWAFATYFVVWMVANWVWYRFLRPLPKQ